MSFSPMMFRAPARREEQMRCSQEIGVDKGDEDKKQTMNAFSSDFTLLLSAHGLAGADCEETVLIE